MGHEGHEQAGADIGKIGAAKAGQESGRKNRRRARRDHTDAGGVKGRGLGAGRFEIEADIAGAEQPGEKDDQANREIDDDVVAEQRRADHGDAGKAGDFQDRRLVEARIGLAELEEVQQGREALGTDGERDADDDLVEALANAEQDDHARHHHAAQAAGEEAHPERAGIIGGDKAGIGPEQHHALNADIEDAGLFRDLFTEAGKEQRYTSGNGAEQQRDEERLGEEFAHLTPLPACGGDGRDIRPAPGTPAAGRPA